MSKTSENKKYSRNLEIIDSQIDDEVVMMNVEKGSYYGLNNIGSAIWEALEEPKSINELVDKFTEEYDVSVEDCKTDITLFIENMVKANTLIKAKP